MERSIIMENLPALVYGTLRPGQPNYAHFLAGATLRERDVVINGYTMHSNKGYPYVVASSGDEEKISATLVDINPADYEEVLEGLDFLEGYHGPNENNHYDRITVDVVLDGETIRAWMYVAHASQVDYIQRFLPVVESGDWVEYVGLRKR